MHCGLNRAEGVWMGNRHGVIPLCRQRVCGSASWRARLIGTRIRRGGGGCCTDESLPREGVPHANHCATDS